MTTILDEAAKRVVDNGWESHSADGPIYCIDARLFADLEAALSAAKPEQGVGVKALEWSDDRIEPIFAWSILGRFTIKHDGDEPEEWSISLNNRMIGQAADDVSAKAFAQAHHDKRIISALATPSTGAVGEPVAWRYEHQFGLNERWHVYFTDEGAPASPPYRNVTPLYAAPPSSERDAALKALDRIRELGESEDGDQTEAMFEVACAALKASRSDTVGPNAALAHELREASKPLGGVPLHARQVMAKAAKQAGE